MYIRSILICIFSFQFFFSKAQESHSIQVMRPNVVLIVSHGHGMGDLGCYGNKIIKTPNLDKLASEGIKFISAYATVSSGSASQSVILTGLYNHANGQYGQSGGHNHFSLFPEIKCLPEYLRDSGYRSASVGVLFATEEKTIPFDTILGIGTNERSIYELAEHCSPFLSRKTNKPFFLYFCPADPFRSNEATDALTSTTNYFGNRKHGYEGIIPTYYNPNKIDVPYYLPDSPECRKELSEYAQSVSRMDLGIGRLFELLKKTGNWENTLIIYITDSGIAFPGAQNNFYEPGIKLPCIIKPPFDKYDNNTCDALINWADLTPTILAFCKALPAEYIFHGRSFKDVMLQKQPAGWDELYASHTFHEVTMYYPMRMVMTRRYKLIWNIAWHLPFPISNDLLNSDSWQATLNSNNTLFGRRAVKDLIQRAEYELYDLITDPDEIKNLALSPEYEGVLIDLKARLRGFQVKTNDPWIIF